MLPYELEFLIALIITVSIELAVIVFLVKVFYKNERFTMRNVFFSGTLPSVTTLPYVWFVFPYFITERQLYLVSVESFAVVVESLIIALILKCSLKQGFLFSLITNIMSATLGFFLKGVIVDFLLSQTE